MTDPTHCETCGTPHTAGCAGHRRDGAPCGSAPIRGGRVCRMHGGSAPQVRRKAAAVVAAQRAQAAVDRLGLRRTGLTAAELLQETVERVGADLEYLGGKAAEGEKGAAAAYLSVMDTARKVAKASLDAGVQDRLAQLDAARVALSVDALVSVLDKALTAAGLDAGQADRVRRAVGAELAALASE